METKTELLANRATHVLSSEQLKQFFITHLDKIYCAKSHLQERLPEMREKANFTDLAYAITEMMEDVEKQITRMDDIYNLLATKPGFENCQGMIGMIEDAFSTIDQKAYKGSMRDLSILFYLQNIESIEKTSFLILKLVVPQVNKKQIRQLIKENFDEANEDFALLQLITSSYFQANVKHKQSNLVILLGKKKI